MSTNGPSSPRGPNTKLSSEAVEEHEKAQMTSDYLNNQVAEKQNAPKEPYQPKKVTFIGTIFLLLGACSRFTREF